jgi:protein phosphatase 1 regulatory subunit 10
MSAAQIPDSAVEPSQQIQEDQVDVNVRIMVTGSDVDSIFWTGPQPAAVNVEPVSVSQLVQQLGVASQNPLDAQDPNKTFPMEPSLLSTMASFGNVTPEHLTHILASIAGHNGYLGQQQAGGGASSIPSYNAAGDQTWNMNQYGGGDYGYDESNGHDSRRFSSDTGWEGRGRGSGRRGRGGGRGGVSEAYKDSRKRKPCTFFAQGRRASNSPPNNVRH